MSDFQRASRELIDAGRQLYAMGMVPATSGNFSARLIDGTLAITVSGRHKGRLSEVDIMRVNMQGESLDGQRPSAETLLHTCLYQRYSDAGVILHPHSVVTGCPCRDMKYSRLSQVLIHMSMPYHCRCLIMTRISGVSRKRLMPRWLHSMTCRAT